MKQTKINFFARLMAIVVQELLKIKNTLGILCFFPLPVFSVDSLIDLLIALSSIIYASV
jgi:hypothetical protein